MEEKKQKLVAVGIVVVLLVVIGVLTSVLRPTVTDDEKEIMDNAMPSTNKVKIYEHTIAEEAMYDGLSIKVNSYSYEQSFAGVSVSSATDNTLLVASITITNTTNKKIVLNETLFAASSSVYSYVLVYDDNYKYYQIYAQYSDFLASHDDIKPLETITAVACYDIPKIVMQSSTKSLKISFSLNRTYADVFHFWILR